MSRHRLEITLSDEQLRALDAARGHEPRASFVKRALETFAGLAGPQASPPREPVMPTVQRPVSANERPAVESPQKEYVLPKIAKRQW